MILPNSNITNDPPPSLPRLLKLQIKKQNVFNHIWFQHYSTLSSGLSSLSALVWQDFVRPHTKPMSEFKATLIAKVSGTNMCKDFRFYRFYWNFIIQQLFWSQMSLFSFFSCNIWLFGNCRCFPGIYNWRNFNSGEEIVFVCLFVCVLFFYLVVWWFFDVEIYKLSTK